MNLSDKEAQLLRVIEHRADLPVSKISKFLKARHHTVQYAIEQLKTRGVIVGIAPFINIYPLGYTDHTLFFSVSSKRESNIEQFLNALINSKYVSWVAKLGGEFQYAVAFCVRYVEDLMSVLQNLSKQFGDIFFEKQISVRVSFHAFGRKYLWQDFKQSIEYKFGGERVETEIDELDHKILHGLSNKNYRSNLELTKALGIPSSTFERRLLTLKKKGIVLGFIYRLNALHLNMHSYRLLIHSRGINRTFTSELFSYARNHPQITHFIECMGAWDYELGVDLKTPENVTEIIKDLYNRYSGSINSIKLAQIFRHLKFSSYPL